MSQYPKVADLVKMGGGRRRDPKDSLILPMAEMILLHEVIMAAPPKGDGLAIEPTDKRLTVLRDHAFVYQDPASGRWRPTHQGMEHVMPTRPLNRAARRAAEKILDGVNQVVEDQVSKIVN